MGYLHTKNMMFFMSVIFLFYEKTHTDGLHPSKSRRGTTLEYVVMCCCQLCFIFDRGAWYVAMMNGVWVCEDTAYT